jgi:hypothetical protein
MKKESNGKKNYWCTYSYPENKILGDQLLFGDKIMIAKTLNLSYSYIKKIFDGKRHNDQVVQMGKTILASRNQEVRKMQEAES